MLAGNADQARLRELSDMLLAPSATGATSPGQPLLQSWDGQRLLRDTVVKEMMRNRATQALAMEIKDRLGPSVASPMGKVAAAQEQAPVAA